MRSYLGDEYSNEPNAMRPLILFVISLVQGTRNEATSRGIVGKIRSQVSRTSNPRVHQNFDHSTDRQPRRVSLEIDALLTLIEIIPRCLNVIYLNPATRLRAVTESKTCRFVIHSCTLHAHCTITGPFPY
jgi:hypothetical protein